METLQPIPMAARRVFLILPLFFLLSLERHARAIGEETFVHTSYAPGDFVLVDVQAANILIDKNDWPGVARAANDLATDVNRVTGKSAAIFDGPGFVANNAVIVGTLGKRGIIDRLIREKRIDAAPIAGEWESFFLQVVPHPLPGIDRALVICGSDKRGTIYGIYDLSEQMGVSPWHYWADVPATHHSRLFVSTGKFVQGPPSVKYRGVFLNDEAPDLSDWVREKYGEVPGHPGAANYGRGFYTNLFEVILRLRGNYLWPAMWNNAFNEDDPENARLADEYGIVMGTSHQEPMLRAQKEWDRSPGRQFGNWDYHQPEQRPVLAQFWREGVRRNKHFESIITLGLRAENDSGQEFGKDLTEQVVKAQRQILVDEMNFDVREIPQVWCLYKEVMGYYQSGLRVPDDVTLLWPDDNWGNLRRLPTASERLRTGGAGVYYHLDYHGGPRSYQWINTSPIPKVWDQLSLAQQYGATRIWIANAGHFKGYEFPLEFFMHLAWDTDRWTGETLDEYTQLWAEREFGAAPSAEIAQLITAYTKFNGRCKPELLDANTYSLVNYNEFEAVVADYAAIADRAQKVYDELPGEKRDAFYELVQFPVQACAQLNAFYLAAARNALYAKQGRASANDWAAQTCALFAAQTNLIDHFNRVFAGGKWNHFMDQTYIGYTSWKDPPCNSMDALKLTLLPVPAEAEMGVAIEGSSAAWPAATNPAVLPAFDNFNRQRRFVDVFNKGHAKFDFTATADSPWIQVSETEGQIEEERRIWISVDWSQAPVNQSTGSVKFLGTGREVTVLVPAFRPAGITPESLSGFVEADGFVAIESEHYTAKSRVGENCWIKIPSYGLTLSGMRASGPADTRVTPGKDSPCLEYKMFLFTAGPVEVEAVVGATLNFQAGRELSYAISFDDEPPRCVTVVPADFNVGNGNQDWEETVKNNCHRVTSQHRIGSPGYHILKIWMVDPSMVLEKLVVNTGGLRPSHLGPPESYHRQTPNVSRRSNEKILRILPKTGIALVQGDPAGIRMACNESPGARMACWAPGSRRLCSVTL